MAANLQVKVKLGAMVSCDGSYTREDDGVLSMHSWEASGCEFWHVQAHFPLHIRLRASADTYERKRISLFRSLSVQPGLNYKFAVNLKGERTKSRLHWEGVIEQDGSTSAGIESQQVLLHGTHIADTPYRSIPPQQFLWCSQATAGGESRHRCPSRCTLALRGFHDRI